jgi:hypothetical protein
MELLDANMRSLFAQLGEPDDDASIARFIERNGNLTGDTRLHEASFWSPTQAAFLREAMQDDATWAPVVDMLNVKLHQARPTPDGAAVA